jgi:hypothetical protein
VIDGRLCAGEADDDQGPAGRQVLKEAVRASLNGMW